MGNIDIINSNFIDELKVEGVNFLGFGVIPKKVMLDQELTCEAKAIYAYFCSYAGSGNTAFPGYKKIISDLKINKDSYYKHLKLLVEQGFIKIEQKHLKSGIGKGFANNVYTLIAFPSKYATKSDEKSVEQACIKNSSLKELGYGLIPKAVMTDQRLSIKAKALYSYYVSFAGAGNCVSPEKKNILYHLKISSNTYLKFQKELVNTNYITVCQRNIKGSMGVNDIYINEKPFSKEEKDECNTPRTNFSETQNPEPQDVKEEETSNNISMPYTKFSETQNPETQKTEIQNSEANINNKNNNKYKNQQNIKEGRGQAYIYSGIAGTIELSMEQHNSLNELFEDLEGLYDLALCSLAQRNTAPKSIFHFVYELGIIKKWKKKEKSQENRSVKTAKEKLDKFAKELQDEKDRELEECVKAYQTEKGIDSYEEARKKYFQELEERNASSLKKFGLNLSLKEII